MKSRFISKRWLGSLMLSMAGVWALSALPAQAQAAVKEEAVVKQLQKVISKCPDSADQDEVKQMLMQIGFRETFSAGSVFEGVNLSVMERETPILLLGQPTQKFAFVFVEKGESDSERIISVVFPRSAFNTLKKYQRGNNKDLSDGLFVFVRQADEGVYVSCVNRWSGGYGG